MRAVGELAGSRRKRQCSTWRPSGTTFALPADMSGRLPSSVAVAVVGLLVGSTTLPLVLCVGRCPTAMVLAPPPHHCHQSSPLHQTDKSREYAGHIRR